MGIVNGSFQFLIQTWIQSSTTRMSYRRRTACNSCKTMSPPTRQKRSGSSCCESVKCDLRSCSEWGWVLSKSHFPTPTENRFRKPYWWLDRWWPKTGSGPCKVWYNWKLEYKVRHKSKVCLFWCKKIQRQHQPVGHVKCHDLGRR